MPRRGRICVSITARSRAAALEKIARAGSLADILELRLDLMTCDGSADLIKASPVPVIATLRSRREGGRSSHTAAASSDILLGALEQGADYVDVEAGLPEVCRRRLIERAGAEKVILSRHFTGGTPGAACLRDLLHRMMAEDAGMIKIVTTARGPEDVQRVLGLLKQAKSLGCLLTAFCMGPAGTASRIQSLRMGSALGFASLEYGEETADGQIPVEVMRRHLPKGAS